MAQQDTGGDGLEAVKQQVVTLLRSSQDAKLADELQSALDLPLEKARLLPTSLATTPTVDECTALSCSILLSR